MKILRPYLFMAAFHFLFSLAFISFFVQSFGYSWKVIPLHLGLVSVIIAGITIFFGFLSRCRRFREWRFARHAVAAILTAAFLLLILLYLADYVTNGIWGMNLTFTLIASSLANPEAFTEFSPAWASICVIGAGFTGLVYKFYLVLSRSLMAAVEEMFHPGREFSYFKNRSRAILSSAAVSALAAAFIAFMTITYGSPSWRGEPLANLLMPFPDFHRATVRIEERQSRENYPKGMEFERKNIVIIMADSLRADHMGIYGYERPTTPFLAGLLATGQLKKVEFAVSSSSESICGVMSTLASKYYRDLTNGNFKLHDLLRDQGYRIHFFLSGNHDWYGLREWYGKEIDIYEENGSKDDRKMYECLRQVPDFSGTPAFFFFFLMSTHYIGTKLEAHAVYRPCKLDVNLHAFFGHRQDPVVLTNRYDNGVIQADDFMRKIFATLEDKGYLKDSLVMIMGDHGEGLGEHGHFGHTKYLYQENIRIPFLIYDRSPRPYQNLKFATQLDVAPTVADRLGLPLPACWHGNSLLRHDTRRYSYHETLREPKCRAILYRENDHVYKYIVWEKEGKLCDEELYELTSDTGEERNLIPAADLEALREVRKIARSHR